MTDDSATLRAMAERLIAECRPVVMGVTCNASPSDETISMVKAALLVSQSSWAKEKAELERQRDVILGTLTARANDIRGLEEDIGKLVRVAQRAISASITVMNDVAREKLLEAIEALPMRLRHASRPVTVKE